MITDQEREEFTTFVGANAIRSTFAPILAHICKEPHADLEVDEFHNKDDAEANTSSCTFSFKDAYGTEIHGRIGYDSFHPEKKVITAELWWDEEDYYCLLTSRQKYSKMVKEFIGEPSGNDVVDVTIGWLKKIAHDYHVNGHRPQIYFNKPNEP